VFDVNETLLNLRALDPHFERLFGDPSARQAWFGQFLTSWLTAMVTGVYQDFGTIGGSALEMVAERQGVDLSDEDKQQILGGMQELPPHPEVEENLGRLREAGIRLAALTNSTQQVADAQIDNSGLRDYFEQVLSADAVQRLKPAPEPYRMTAESLGVETGRSGSSQRTPGTWRGRCVPDVPRPSWRGRAWYSIHSSSVRMWWGPICGR